MTVEQLCTYISDRIPASLSCEWDNDGLMVSPDPHKAVRRVLCSLDVTEEAVDYAISHRFDLIISHHPLIFKGIKTLTPSDPVGRKVLRLVQNGISVISLHTRADAVTDGVNDRLCDLLGIEDPKRIMEGGEMICRIGEIPEPMPLSEFCQQVKDVLGAPFVLCADADREVFRVAVCGGDGKDFVSAALAEGADTYLSGRIGYHQMTDAPEMGINLIEAGHYYTETHITEFFAELVTEFIPEAEVEEFSSNVIISI